jgi:phage gp45-like
MNAELVRSIRQLVARVAGLAETGRATSLGRNDQIKSTDPVRRIWPFGLRSVPVQGSEGVVLVINGGRRSGGAAVLVGAENLKYGPQDLKEGETALYSQFDAIIRLDKDGNITIVPKSGAKVKEGSSADSELDQVVTKKDLNDQMKLIRKAMDEHTHTYIAPAMGAPTQTSTGSNVLGADPLVTGSPNVYAKKP